MKKNLSKSKKPKSSSTISGKQAIGNDLTVAGNYIGRDAHYHAAPEPFRPLSRLHQLPPPPPNFTGRTADLDRLRAKVSTGTVTIAAMQGMGGIGKTAIALKLANELAPQYPDAQIFIDLHGFTEGSEPMSAQQAMEAVVHAFHPEANLPEDGEELGRIYRDVLYGKRVLLLMDNARDAVQVESLVPGEGCLMLVTTRNEFTVNGVAAMRVDVLEEEEAVALLEAIAGREKLAGKGGVLAKRLGYLPLALQLAGSALARQAVRVDDYLRKLERLGNAAVGEKLDKVIRLSYDLLNDDHKHRWRALSVFAAAFEPKAVVSIWNQSTDEDGISAVREHLVYYVTLGLLRYDTSTNRFSLHDLVRDFALREMEEKERFRVSFSHSAYFQALLAYAEDLSAAGRGNYYAKGLAIFDSDRLDIEVGQSWAASNMTISTEIAFLTSHYAGCGPHVLTLRLHVRTYIVWLTLALSAIQVIGDRRGEENHLGNLGNAYRSLGDVTAAMACYTKALDIAREIGHRLGEGNGLANLGLAYAALGDISKAIEYYEQALDIAKTIDNSHLEGSILGTLGVAYVGLGDVHKAIEYYKQALGIAREIGDRLGEGTRLGNLGNAHALLGNVRVAIEYSEQALEIDREIGDKRGEGTDLTNLGDSYLELGDSQKAVCYYRQAITILEAIEDPSAVHVHLRLAKLIGE